MIRPSSSFIGIWALSFAVLLQSGCDRNEPQSETRTLASPSPLPEQAPEMSPQRPPMTISWPDLVRDVHQAAATTTSDSARLKLAKKMAELAQDPKRPNRPEAITLAQDLAARSAQIYLRQGQPDEAKQVITAGLSISSDVTVARAQLLMVAADSEEALGNEAAARKALLDALSINQQLFTQELETP